MIAIFFKLKSWTQQSLAAWDQFWFSPKPMLNLALFRIFFGGTFFYLYLKRGFDWRLFYTDEGFLPRTMANEVLLEFFRPPFNWYFWPDSMMGYFHHLMVFGLFLIFVGLSNRFLMILTWVLHISFMQRNFSIAFGADVIGGLFLLYLSFTNCCDHLSLKSWLTKNKLSLPVFFRKFVGSSVNRNLSSEGFWVSRDLVNSVGYRLIQIQLCVIYGYTGFEKLKGSTWWDGTALWSVFANSQMVIADLTFTRHIPIAVVSLTFLTVLFEVYFPVLVWFKKWRKWILFFGVAFHAGIGILMALFAFAFVMMSPYFLFIPPKPLHDFFEKHLGSKFKFYSRSN